jgi:hypothetical protein
MVSYPDIPTRRHSLERDREVARKLLEKLKGASVLRSDIFLAYSSTPHLDLIGFLVSSFNSLNDLIAICPFARPHDHFVPNENDVLRQLKIAIRISVAAQNEGVGVDAIDLRSSGSNPRIIPKWVYGLSCIPLTRQWLGELLHPEPFCPQLFAAMAGQPRAAEWLIQQERWR